METFKAFLKRPELTIFIAAIVASLLASSGLNARAGGPLPDGLLSVLVNGLWAVFIASAFEGVFKPNYQVGWSTLTGGKMRLLGLAVLIELLTAGLGTIGLLCPPAAEAQPAGCFDSANIDQLANYIYLAILGKGALDAATVKLGSGPGPMIRGVG